ncbi:hypothetical protein MRX96_043606 [Rhipicephalus microplus]
MDNASEPAPKRFNAVSESEDDRNCEQDADLVECGEESEGVPLYMQSGPECSSSDEDSPLGGESSDDGVTSDSRTGPERPLVACEYRSFRRPLGPGRISDEHSFGVDYLAPAYAGAIDDSSTDLPALAPVRLLTASPYQSQLEDVSSRLGR